ncbi:hypothetical protein [Ramlibacter pallidus]|uniref:Uncharacterized protein n=1 Tax=Ramlibacter pallidus TaxID=2780087 RepID=A0ABR9S0G0_9BURK|nr:hypothetical protein [Ramlibacter pallidus]MBE7366527.1 hypothetical protein [Ramlibacter pallidus]
MFSVYLHSRHCDFAETTRVPEAAYLGRRIRRSTLKLAACGCDRPVLARITRAFWMRFVPRFRHYLCRGCGDRVFRPKVRPRSGYPSVYLPASR